MTSYLIDSLVLIVIFGLPIAWQRFKRWQFPNSFLKLNLVRRLIGIELHHGHIGLFLILLDGFWATFNPGRWSVAVPIVFVYGLGLIIDELPAYFASTKGVSREEELRVYDKTFPTVIKLAICCACLILLFGYFAK